MNSALFLNGHGEWIPVGTVGNFEWKRDEPTVDSLVQCKKCHRYIERSYEDDEYMLIEHGLPQAWRHAQFFVACNPGTHNQPVYHEPETLDETWARELPRMITDMNTVMEGLA